MNDFQITECMVTSGGNFVVALGKLFRIADSDNRKKLKETFAGYFANYAALAEIQVDRDQIERDDAEHYEELERDDAEMSYRNQIED